MGILLSDKEINKAWLNAQGICDEDGSMRFGKAEARHIDIAKAQLKKVVEWLKDNEAQAIYSNCHDFIVDGDEWQALLKEIE